MFKKKKKKREREKKMDLYKGLLEYIYVTQCELMRLFEGGIKTDIFNSKYCSISKEHFDTKTIFISYSYQKL